MPEEKYSLTVQEFSRVEKGKADMSYGVLTLTSADGNEKHQFYFRSGGFGKGALPGLDGKQINGDDENVTAVFGIGNQQISENGVRVNKKGFAYSGNKGFKIVLESDEVESKTKRNGFLIHPDGGIEGTKGCIGIPTAECERFEEIWSAIPKEMRPDKLLVLKPGSEDLDFKVLSEKFKDEDFSKAARYVVSEEVRQFQELIGAKKDGKFGPESMRKAIEKGYGKEAAAILGIKEENMKDILAAAKHDNHHFFKKLNSQEDFSDIARTGFNSLNAIAKAKNIGKELGDDKFDKGSGSQVIVMNNGQKSNFRTAG